MASSTRLVRVLGGLLVLLGTIGVPPASSALPPTLTGEPPSGVWFFVQQPLPSAGGSFLYCEADEGSAGFTDFLLVRYPPGSGNVFTITADLNRRSERGSWLDIEGNRVVLEERGQADEERFEWFWWLGGVLREEVLYFAWAVWGAPGECLLRINDVDQPIQRLPLERATYVDIEGFEGGVAAQHGAAEASVARRYVRETDGLVVGRLVSGTGQASVIQTDPVGIAQTHPARYVPPWCSGSCRLAHVNRGPLIIEITAGVEDSPDLQTSLWLIDVPYLPA